MATVIPGMDTTANNGNLIMNAPQSIDFINTGVGANEVNLIGNNYKIDIYGDLITHQPYANPTLTIFAGTGSGSCPLYPVWNDDYNGDVWQDIHLDSLRIANDGSATTGGKLAFYGAAGEFSDAAAAALATPNNEVLLTDNKCTLFFVTADGVITGKKFQVAMNLASTLKALGYTESNTGGDGDEVDTWTWGAASTPLYFAFDSLAFETDGTNTQSHQITVKISKFVTNIMGAIDTENTGSDTEAYSFAIELDFSDSNLEYSGTTYIGLSEISNGTHVDIGYTRMSRTALIGGGQEDVPGVAEGSTFSEGFGFNFSIQNISNNVQIFDTPKYGITGTRMAAQARFFDEFAATRRRQLSMFKNRINSAMLRGVKSETFSAATGTPVRTMSGLLDYSLFPLKYIKESLPTETDDGGVELAQWIDNLAYAYNAFKQKDGSSTITVLTSKTVLRHLTRIVPMLGSQSGNIMGGIFTVVPPSKITLGLRIFEFESLHGTVRFIEEPAFEMMPKFKTNTATAGGIPSHLFANGLNPRKMLMFIDKAYVKFLTYRPDKIEGNVQEIGQDAFYEAMRGDHSFQLRFPKNHMLVDVS